MHGEHMFCARAEWAPCCLLPSCRPPPSPPRAQGRANLDKLAKERSIGVFSHYAALHTSPAAAKFARAMVCTEAAECASQLRRLPMWVDLSERNVAAVIALVQDALA
jgi:dTDP-4-amino-4,6-dideoxygalactose transaminase